jgi:hypothetical protein
MVTIRLTVYLHGTELIRSISQLVLVVEADWQCVKQVRIIDEYLRALRFDNAECQIN